MTSESTAFTPTTLPPATYLDLLRADAARMAALAPPGLSSPVPACPGWTAQEVVLHTGAVYSHKVACMRRPTGPQSRDDWDHGPAGGEDLIAWFQERLAELVGELEARGPDAPCYTWHRDHQTVWFWYRRMAQETAVHRVDVESAVGGTTPIDDALAVDGIDEVLDWFLVYQHDDEVGAGGPGSGTVAVRTGDHIWRATLLPDAVELARDPGRADAVVSGEPSELLLWLWGRRPDRAVSRQGDEALLAAFRERLRLVTQ